MRPPLTLSSRCSRTIGAISGTRASNCIIRGLSIDSQTRRDTLVRTRQTSRLSRFFNPPSPSAIFTLASRFASTTTAKELVMSDPNRLPLNVKPKHYDVTIKTDLEKLNFEGSVVIDLDVIHDTSVLVFNSSNLNLRNISLKSDVINSIQEPSSQSYDSESERTTLQFGSTFRKGSKLQLSVSFDAKLTGNMMGYYYSEFQKDGKKGVYTVTQFEPTAARRSFPCWDEPLLKATYSITMISRSDTVNLSNMPVTSEEAYKDNGWKITQFERTPLVSSYLVAFANGPFEHLETSYTSPLSGKSRPLRIYGTSDIIHHAQYSLDVKKEVLPIFEKVFDIEYPLPKLDTLVVHDFDSGAMENWGLITGRTESYLVDPVKGGINSKKGAATTQCHEVAHMWFGNITTMAWWDNLYLNEGFATLMGEAIILNKIRPEWKAYTALITSKLNPALSLDAKLSSHPIEVECPDANRINQIFDRLSYAKAASVLRMLSSFVGEDVFLKGVSIYLKKHLYGNSVSKDLWDGISESSGIDITTMMDNWICKMGFPILTVTETSNGIHIRQDRFLETGPAPDEHNQTIWQIPLNLVRTDSSGNVHRDKTLLFKKREITLPIDPSLPYKLNADTTGVYRVLYPPERLTKIAEEAAKGETIFSLNDRLGLVHDAFGTAFAGFANISSALNIVQLLHDEQEFLIWQGIKEKLGGIYAILSEDEKMRELLKAFLRYLYGPFVKKLGMEYNDSDSVDTNQLRTLMITGAASAGDMDVVNEMKKRFEIFLDTGDDSKIPTDLEDSIYHHAVRYGDRKQYNAMKEIYANPKTASSRIAAIAGLCATEDPIMMKETFNFILNDAKEQDVYRFFRYLSWSHASRRAMANYMKDNYDEIYRRFSTNTQLEGLVKFSFDMLTSEEDALDVEKFFEGKDISKFDLGLRQTLDTIRSNGRFISRSSDDIQQWLERWSSTEAEL